ncbi:MAG: beta strand repeat-containing protein, partial [Leucobacter sp.]
LAVPVPPTITDLTPTEGPETGGTEVTITGTGFTDATGVTFDGTAGTAFTVDSDTQITVTTPAGTPGLVDVIIEHPVESSTPGEFTYLAVPVPPTITDLTPTEGPETGGTEVTITGTGFTDATGVTFDGTIGTAFDVVSDTEITATTPAGDVGTADVIIEHPVGNSEPGTFTYLAVPSITDLTPTEGPETGGTVVTITGTGFTDASGVTFAGTAGTVFDVVSDTQITVTTPAGTPGVADVIVEHPVEDSTPGDFTYLAVPSVTELTPTEGPETGGTEVTIIGTGFTGATGVTFEGVAGVDFNVDSDTEITVTTPAGTPGVADVIVEHPVEDSTPGDFTYLAVPSITDLTPTEGPETGGTVVTITGTGFTDATAVTFDETAGTAFDVVSDTQITVTTPAGTPGVADVIIEHPVEDSSPGGFTYLAVPPVISGITPNTGPETGGTTVTITGSDFTDATGVTFDGAPGTSFIIVNDTTITVVTPPGTVGVADVVVEHPAGNSDPGEFTYTEVVNAPTITNITPDTGPQTGGTEVTITGTDFTDATEVTFDGVPGTDLVVVNETTITVTTPAGNVGPAEVVVITPGGSSAPGEFTYTEVAGAPTITGIAPNNGPQTGGTDVTITGSGFTGATGVTFDGAEGTTFTVDSDTTITVTTPAGPVGPADVVVLHPAGNSGPGVFTYTAVPGSPTITDITPDTGPQTGGTEVTITGTWFSMCTAVTFDGVAGTDFRVVNDNTIVVTTPAGSVGVADVVVTCPLGSSNPGQFTYTAVSDGGTPTIAVTGGSALPFSIMVVLLLAGAALLTLKRVSSRRA